MENWTRKFKEFKSASEARYQKSIANGKMPACLQTVFVPDDYPTIQEAIDAVCDNGMYLLDLVFILNHPEHISQVYL